MAALLLFSGDLIMKIRHSFAQLAMVGLLALGVAGPAGAVTRKERNTVIGAGVGALAGAVLTEGNVLATLGGAAAGGVLGNIITEDRREYRSHGRDRGHYGHHGHYRKVKHSRKHGHHYRDHGRHHHRHR